MSTIEERTRAERAAQGFPTPSDDLTAHVALARILARGRQVSSTREGEDGGRRLPSAPSTPGTAPAVPEHEGDAA